MIHVLYLMISNVLMFLKAFFKYPQSMAISRNIENNYMNINGIKIEDNFNLEDRLYEYIKDNNPLTTCSY